MSMSNALVRSHRIACVGVLLSSPSTTSSKTALMVDMNPNSYGYNQATEKLQDECKNLNKEIKRIKEEISELDPQVQITAQCCDVHLESIALSAESLINQRCYTKCVIESNKKCQEEMDHTVDEYSKHIQLSKEKLKCHNPTYKVLLTKKNELKSCKIRCLQVQQKILQRNRINKQKMDIKQKQFYAEIVAFAQAWVDNKKYSETLRLLKEETAKEREHMQKLADLSELLKQKQKQAMFKIPQIEFTHNLNDSNQPISERATKSTHCNNLGNNQISSYLSELQTMLQKTDSAMDESKTPADISDSQKLEFKAGRSKVRILENKMLKSSQTAPKALKMRSREERSKIIEEKLKKAVDSFNKTMSRHNSKQHMSLSQKSLQGESKQGNCEKKLSPSCAIVEQDTTTEPAGSGATQELNKLNISQEINGSQEMAKYPNQSSKNAGQEGNPYFHQNAKVATKMEVDPVKPKTILGKKKLSQEIKFPRAVSFMSQSKPEGGNFPVSAQFSMRASEFGQTSTLRNYGPRNSTKENNFCAIPAKEPPTSRVEEKPQAMAADIDKLLNTGNKESDDGKNITETSVEDSGNFFKMGSFNFGNNNQFSQMLNETSDLDEGFKSPEMDYACDSLPSGQEDNNINFGRSNFADKPFFSFGQPTAPFGFI